MPDTLQDTMVSFYRTVLGRDASLVDLEREFFILNLGDGVYSRTWADAAYAYFRQWNGGTGGSLADEAFKYYSSLSGLTPVERFTLTDHMYQVYAVNGGLNTTPPITDNLEAFYDASAIDGYLTDGRVSKNLLTVNQASAETDTTGMVGGSGVTVSRSTAANTFKSGVAGFGLVASAAGTRQLNTLTGTSGIPVVPGRTYSGTVSFRASLAGRTGRTLFQWFDAAGGSISSVGGATTGITDTGWTTLTYTAVAPENAAFVALIGAVGSIAGAETHYVDELGFWEGTSTDWVLPGKLHNINLLTYNQATVEYDTTGFSVFLNSTISRSTAQAKSGSASLAVTSTGALDASASTDTVNRIPVVAGKTYTAVGSARSSIAGRACRVTIQWYNSVGGSVTESVVSAVSINTSGWTSIPITVVAPANSVTAVLRFYTYTPVGAGEITYWDEIGLWEGSVTTWVPPYRGTSGLNDGDRVSFWRDLSGKNRHAIQATAANQPEFRKPSTGVSKNLLTYNQASAETDTTGWTGDFGTFTSSTDYATHGSKSFKLVATSTSSHYMYSPIGTSGIPIKPNTAYSLVLSVRGTVTKLFRYRIFWYNSSGVLITAVGPASVAMSTTQWDFRVMTATSPANAVYAAVELRQDEAAVIGDTFYVDQIGLWEGTSQNWVAPGLPFRNLLTYNQATVETDTTGLQTTNAVRSIARSTAQALHGTASIIATWLTAGSGADQVGTSLGVLGTAVVPGKTYTAVVASRAETTGRLSRCRINWYDSGGASLSITDSASISNTSSGWTIYAATGVAPANAVFAGVSWLVTEAPIIGEVHYIDQLGLTEGPNTVWEPPVTQPNNKPCVQFGNSWLSCNELSSVFNGNDVPTTVYVVTKLDVNHTLSYFTYWGAGSSLGTNNRESLGTELTPKAVYYIKQDTVPSTIALAGATSANFNYNIFSKVSASDPLVTVFLNGVSEVSSAINIGVTSHDRFTIGAQTRTSVDFKLYGTITALLVYTGAHSAAQRQQIERWLGSRYGVAVA